MSRYRSNRAGLSGIIKDSKRGGRAAYAARDAATESGVQSVESEATVTKWIRLEGPVTGQETTPGSGLVPTAIGLGIVTDSMLADMPEAMVKGRAVGAGTGSPSNLDAAALIAILMLADGSGSGLDADLLDGQHGAYYLPAASYTAADVLAKLLTVDGAGSGLDADFLDGLSSAAFQPIDADLTALAALAGTGIPARTGIDAWALRTINGTAGRVTVANGSGAAGNPTIDLDTLAAGAGGTFQKFTRDAYGRVSAVTPVVAADVSALLDSDLSALAALATTGLVARTGAATYATRTILGGNLITVTNGDGVSGNITIAVQEGAGSGLDADTIDGLDSAAFMRRAINTAITDSAGNTRFYFEDAVGNRTRIYGGLDGTGFYSTGGTQIANISNAGNAVFEGQVTVKGGNVFFDVAATKQLSWIGADAVFTGFTALKVGANTVWHAGNDGAGSGLDADLLDGVQLSRIVYGGYDTAISDEANLTNTAKSGFYQSGTGQNGPGAATWTWYMAVHHSNPLYSWQLANPIGEDNLYFRRRQGGAYGAWGKIWTSSNDGSGTGLDADLLDGLNSSQFIRNDVHSATVLANRWEIGQNQASVTMASAAASAVAFQVMAGGNAGTAGPAQIAFHRPGAYATHFGVDTDNEFKFGNWSDGGGIVYKFWNEKNSPQGTYTPTATGVANISSVTPTSALYFRHGNNVHVSGRVTFTTPANTTTRFRLTLPIASNLTAAEHLNGTATDPSFNNRTAGIEADTVNDAAEFEFLCPAGTFTFTYSYDYRVQ